MIRPARARSGRRKSHGPRSRAVELERYRPIVADWPAFLEAAALPEPTVFRVRSGRIDERRLIERLASRGFRTEPVAGMPGFHRVIEGPGPVSLTLEHWQGLLYVQQASTGVAAPALAPTAGERILDLCAAPGGKTTHMAELMDDRGCVVASEISESRIRGLLGNVYRLCHSNILAVAADGRAFPAGALFDRVLVDAPCSGEGTLRRRSGQVPDQSRSFLGYVTAAQRALLERAVRLTRPGGVVLYVTCTFAPEENEAVVSDALARLPVELEPLDLDVPHAPGITSFEGERFDSRVEGAARIYPHHLDSGGLFLARLRRLDDGSSDANDAWSTVPPLFPDEDQVEPTSETELADAANQVERGVEELRARFGIGGALTQVDWTMRGGRAWVHTVGEWPLAAWPPGSWRGVSLGLRAVEFDSRGRPRPTNDFLRWLDRAVEAVDLPRDRLEALLGGAAIETTAERRGPVALAFDGEVIGRGAVTDRGLVSEIPKARARDLARVLAGPSSDDEEDHDD